MQTVTINTTQNIGIDYEMASLGERILAFLIDYGVFIAVLIIMAITDSFRVLGGTASAVVGLSLLALYVLYDLICEVAFNGQSLGKRVMKIRVISLNGGRPTFGQYLLRWLFRIVDTGLSFYLAGLLCAALTKKTQRIGDLVANTGVIRTQPRARFEHIVFRPEHDGYQPIFSQVAELNDKDISLINDVIIAFSRTGNATIVYTTAAKLKELLAAAPPAEMNDLQFLQTLIKDYSHIVAANGQTIGN